MKTVALAFLALAFQTPTGQAAKDADQKVYTNGELGLSFNYPKTWKTSKVKVHNRTTFNIKDPKTWRPAKTDETNKFLIPLPGTEERGVMEIYSVQFFSEPDIWQYSQKDINDQLKRPVLRQWQEEVLGVPLLMTKIQSTDKGTNNLTETGLMYSATPRKLVFRLTASPENFDKADHAFRDSVLQSIHTVDGKLPSTEDPNRKLTREDLKPGSIPPKIIWTAPVPKALPPVKGNIAGQVEAGGKKIDIRLPAGWKLQKQADGSMLVTRPDLSKTAKLSVASSLDSDPPVRALLKSTGLDLQKFTKVSKRTEKGPYLSRAGVSVAIISREGLAGAKPFYSSDAAGVNGDFYWLLTWTSENAATYNKDRRLLEDLIEVMNVEVAS